MSEKRRKNNLVLKGLNGLERFGYRISVLSLYSKTLVNLKGWNFDTCIHYQLSSA